MSAQPETNDFFESLEFQVTCSLAHRVAGSQRATPCNRPARWMGRIHRCSDRAGFLVVFCQEFFDLRVNQSYPIECVGCSIEFKNFTDLVWDFHRL